MKKIFLSTVITFACIAGLSAQATEFDAIRMAQTDIIGTARYMGMAGAFGALGGDVSAIKINPAGLGIYRSSDVTATFNFATQRANANWGGHTAQDDLFGFGFNNVALVLASPTWNSRAGNTTGLLQSNWGFSYNRLKNFNRNVSVRGGEMAVSITDYLANFTNGIPESEFGRSRNPYDNVDLPWMSILAYETYLINNNGDDTWSSVLFQNELVSPRYHLRESGFIDQFVISWGGNFSNTLYFGANLNVQQISYNVRSNYIERFGDYESLDLFNDLQTTGSGISFDVGLIYRPVDFLRFGFSYKTPMRYRLTDTHFGDMRTTLVLDNERQRFNERTDNRLYNYNIRIPAVMTASAAGIIGKRAVISGDFSFTNFRSIKLYDTHDGAMYYDEENERIRNTFNNGITVRLGTEYRLTDHWSVRAGFAAITSPMPSTAMKQQQLNTTRTDPDFFRHRGTNYLTAGLGYRSGSWYFDAAFVNRNIVEDFMPYALDRVSSARVVTRNYDVVTTVGFRF